MSGLIFWPGHEQRAADDEGSDKVLQSNIISSLNLNEFINDAWEMPLCVLIYGGCQYQQNVIYCIKMRSLLLLWVSPVRLTWTRELRTSQQIINKQVSLLLWELRRGESPSWCMLGTVSLVSLGCRRQLMLTNCQRWALQSAGSLVRLHHPTVQCLSVPGRVFALQIEKVVSMDQMWAANTVTLKIYGPDCLAWLPPPPR